MAQHDSVENSGAKIFSHQHKQSLRLALNVRKLLRFFLFHTDTKPELEPAEQVQRLKSALCHHVPVRGRRQRVFPVEREAEMCCQAVTVEEL